MSFFVVSGCSGFVDCCRFLPLFALFCVVSCVVVVDFCRFLPFFVLFFCFLFFAPSFWCVCVFFAFLLSGFIFSRVQNYDLCTARKPRDECSHDKCYLPQAEMLVFWLVDTAERKLLREACAARRRVGKSLCVVVVMPGYQVGVSYCCSWRDNSDAGKCAKRLPGNRFAFFLPIFAYFARRESNAAGKVGDA